MEVSSNAYFAACGIHDVSGDTLREWRLFLFVIMTMMTLTVHEDMLLCADVLETPYILPYKSKDSDNSGVVYDILRLFTM